MLVTLSSKGQLVLPKSVRETLHLSAGARLRVEVDGEKIVLEPVVASPIDELSGMFTGVDFLSELEAEHREELEAERREGSD